MQLCLTGESSRKLAPGGHRNHLEVPFQDQRGPGWVSQPTSTTRPEGLWLIHVWEQLSRPTLLRAA